MRMHNLLSLPHLLARQSRDKKTISRKFEITCQFFLSVFKYFVEKTMDMATIEDIKKWMKNEK